MWSLCDLSTKIAFFCVCCVKHAKLLRFFSAMEGIDLYSQ